LGFVGILSKRKIKIVKCQYKKWKLFLKKFDFYTLYWKSAIIIAKNVGLFLAKKSLKIEGECLDILKNC